jgi:hypothetical protein
VAVVRFVVVLLCCGGLVGPAVAQTDLEVMAGAQTLGSDDFGDTYGLLPFAGIGVSWPAGSRTQVTLSARYCRSSGDLFYDVPEFQMDRQALLQSVPVMFAVRENLVPSRQTRFLGGIAMQMAWIEEKLPAGTDLHGQDTNAGYGFGLLLTLGPEWRTRDLRRAVGLEFGLGGYGADIGSGRARHEVDLTGFQIRAYVTAQIGGASAMEVQP